MCHQLPLGAGPRLPPSFPAQDLHSSTLQVSPHALPSAEPQEVPTPSRQARHRLLELHLGASQVELSEADWELLVTRTEGLSGSDIATVVADALLQPVRELEDAAHWRPTQEGGVTPCAASDSGALRRSLSELLPQQVTVGVLLLPSEGLTAGLVCPPRCALERFACQTSCWFWSMPTAPWGRLT